MDRGGGVKGAVVLCCTVLYCTLYRRVERAMCRRCSSVGGLAAPWKTAMPDKE